MIAHGGEEKSFQGDGDYRGTFADVPGDVEVTLREKGRGASLVVPMVSPFRIVAPADFTLGDTIQITLTPPPRLSKGTKLGLSAIACNGSSSFEISELPFLWDTSSLVARPGAVPPDAGADSGAPVDGGAAEPCSVSLSVESFTLASPVASSGRFHPETRTLAKRYASTTLIAHRDR